MHDVRIQPTALSEFEEIVAYLKGFGEQAASSFLDEWEKALRSLSEGLIEYRLSRFALLARLGYHTVLVKNYILLYYREGNVVVIAHVFHQSQDYASIVLNGF